MLGANQLSDRAIKKIPADSHIQALF
jgi:hypothetical protein